MILSTRLRWYAIAVIICCLVSVVSANAAKTDPKELIPDPDVIIRNILGVDEMSRNVCLIDSHQMVNAADLPGRLVAISADQTVPSDLLRYSFRKVGTKGTTQINPPTTPVQVTRLEWGRINGCSILNWFGAAMSREDLAELRTTPLPATSISVDDLDEEAITARFSEVPQDIRRGLGIITDVIPYEVCASICKKTTTKTEAGVWYIKLGRDTYCKQSDELRKYYMVVVYTPLVFYDDIGIFNTVKSTEIDDPLPPAPLDRRKAFDVWLKNQGEKLPGKFSEEGKVGFDNASDEVRTN